MRLSLATNYETTNDKRGDDDAITMIDDGNIEDDINIWFTHTFRAGARNLLSAWGQ